MTCAVALLALLAMPAPAAAHPLGNFTVNTYNGLRVEPDAVAVRMIVDYAEIPTAREFPTAYERGGASDPKAADFAAEQCAELAPGAQLHVGGRRQPLSVGSAKLVFVPGVAGLQTMRLTCELRTEGGVQTVDRLIEYVDSNSLDRLGWREITAVGDGVDLTGSDVPTESVSAELTRYPPDLLSSPLDEQSARARAVPGSGEVSGATAAAEGASSEQAGGLTSAFTELVAARELGVGFALVALAISVGLGVLHAFAPGHGKTLMAAYMLGQQRSSVRQVALIGLTVTLTHTTGVLVLGVVLSAFALTAPEQIYAWLGVASGLLLVAIGISLLRQAQHRSAPLVERVRDSALAASATGRGAHPAYDSPGDHAEDRAHPHDHGHEHDHGHDHGHDHEHEPGEMQRSADVGPGTSAFRGIWKYGWRGRGGGSAPASRPGEAVTHSHGIGGTHTHAAPSATTSARRLIAVGFVGGMVPAPSALIVLLGGIAIGRAWFGVLLVIGYGLGMAVALTGTGVALAYARDRIERLADRRRSAGRWRWAARISRALPVLTACLVVVVGVGLLVRATATLVS
ncbi:hypothetical protein BH20ACT6_BH20ACT6_06150 [soil metagenome]